MSHGSHRASHRAPRPARAGGQRVLAWVSNVALVTCLLAFLALAVGPHLLGYRTAAMLSGSMEPEIATGDLVVTVPRPAADVQVGDVITFRIPVEDHRVETHRVTEVVERRDGSVAVRTKGDANPAEDPWLATIEGDTVHEVVGVVPMAGTVIRAARSPLVRDGLFWAALVLVVPVGLSLIWRRREPDQPVAPAAGEVLDVSALRELAPVAEGVGDFGRHFARRYHELLPRRTSRIVAALDIGDLEAALDAVLSLKVSSLTVGARELAAVARAMEERIRVEDVAGARSLVAGLRPAVDRADQALTGYLAA